MKKSKAEVGIGTFMTLFIAVAVGLILLVGGKAIADYVNKEKYTHICRLSIEKAHYSKFGVMPEGFVANKLDCLRKYVTFYKDKIEANVEGEKFKLKPEYEELSENVIKKGIAEELANCWYMVGEGNYKPFDQKLMSDGGIGCIVCSIINFDKGLPKEFQNRKIIGLIEFLKDNNRIGKKTKYYDYLVAPKYVKIIKPFSFYKLKKVGEEPALEIDDIGEIDTGKTYYIMYTGFIPRVIKWDFWAGLKNDLKFFFGLDLGESEEILGLLFLIEDKDLKELNCGFLYN